MGDWDLCCGIFGKGWPAKKGERQTAGAGRRGGQVVAERLGRWSPGGASAERMYRTLTDPAYQRSTNKHGRRINSRNCTPMHVMAAHALRQLPNQQGNLNQASSPSSFLSLPTPPSKTQLFWLASHPHGWVNRPKPTVFCVCVFMNELVRAPLCSCLPKFDRSLEAPLGQFLVQRASTPLCRDAVFNGTPLAHGRTPSLCIFAVFGGGCLRMTKATHK